ncbi:MAG TPA: group I intron-associated PD-(D/E)XK endonuclease [Solirubrobacteraceae bacterium]|nr:group I intron-associated PD-(D/E)XK endonuclease [Solirubrobacteraceae bacterium]
MQLAWTPRRQGDAGELSAMTWLFSAGAEVYVPLFTNSDVDLIADFGDRIDRVQVKTSTCWQKNRFVVALCTRGGNQSWNGIVKRLDATRCDRVFVHVGDGRRWYIPAAALGGGTAIVLGGPKYAEYEVGPGEPLQARPPPTSGPRA